jgi:uncharacterized membrane protein
MPYTWQPHPPGPDATEAPFAHLRAWPHRSLPPEGFVWFIGVTAVLLAVPLLTVFGSPVVWALLPFLLAALAAIWFAIQRNNRDRAIVEDLRIHTGRVTLERRGPRGKVATWEANPHWVQITLHPTGGPVPDYLTLKAGGREVELGAFLTEDERVSLCDEMQARLRDLAVQSNPLA